MAEEKKTVKAKEEKTSEAKKPSGKTVQVAQKACKAAPQLSAGSVQITLRRALIGRKKEQIAVATSLGLRRMGDVSIQPDNAATAGKITKISFLIDVKKA